MNQGTSYMNQGTFFVFTPPLRALQAVGVIPVAFLNIEQKYATSSTQQRRAMSPTRMSVESSNFLAREMRMRLIYSVVVRPVIALTFLLSWILVMQRASAIVLWSSFPVLKQLLTTSVNSLMNLRLESGTPLRSRDPSSMSELHFC